MDLGDGLVRACETRNGACYANGNSPEGKWEKQSYKLQIIGKARRLHNSHLLTPKHLSAFARVLFSKNLTFIFLFQMKGWDEPLNIVAENGTWIVLFKKWTGE